MNKINIPRNRSKRHPSLDVIVCPTYVTTEFTSVMCLIRCVGISAWLMLAKKVYVLLSTRLLKHAVDRVFDGITLVN